MYYADAKGVIFVIDSADRLRMAVAKDELETILEHDAINKNNAIFLFFANKSDLANSCTAVEVAQLLDLLTGSQNNLPSYNFSFSHQLNSHRVVTFGSKSLNLLFCFVFANPSTSDIVTRQKL